MWCLQPQLAGIFSDGFGKTDFVKKNYGKIYEELTEDEKKKVDSEYAEYSKEKEKPNVLRGYDRFINIQEKLGKRFEDIATQLKKNTSLFDPVHTVYTWESEQAENRLQEIARRRAELTELIKTDPDNSEKYKQENASLEEEIKNIGQKNLQMQMDPRQLMLKQLSEKGKDALLRPV